MGILKLTPKNPSAIFTIVGIFTGIILSLFLKNFTRLPWTDRNLMQLQFIGEILLRSVNCLILPLIVSSIVSASCNITKSSRSIGLKTIYYYLTTTILGIGLCVILTQTIRPGEFHQKDDNKWSTMKYSKKFITLDIFLDLFRCL